jgi:predicted RNA-binding Zn-ribbon protein involved in translation (DUF1610 family)
MPRGDGTGPPWGSNSGTGRGTNKVSKGAGMMKGSNPGAGPGGECVCPNCGARTIHRVGTPCYNLICPKCGKKMARI